MFARQVPFIRPHRRLPTPETPAEIERVSHLQYFVPKFKYCFDYTVFESVFRPRLAEAIAFAHISYVCRFRRGTAMGCFYAFRRLGENTRGDRKLASKLRQARSVQTGAGALLWREAVASRVQALERKRIELTSFAEEIGSLFRALDELASLGLVAKCSRPALPKNYHAASKPRPGLVEQSGKQPVSEAMLADLEAHIDRLNLPLKGADAHTLLRALAAQVPKEVLLDEVAVAEAIFRLNANALEDVRRVAEDTFIYWRDVWRKGQGLLKGEGNSVVAAVNFAKRLPKHLGNAPRRVLFAPELGERALGNFLRLFIEQGGQYVPANAERGWPFFMRYAYWELGGAEYMDACYCLHRRGVAAAVILYLVDSGANISTALNLTVDSEQPTDDVDFVRFVSFKDRAGPDPIIKDLPLVQPGIRVTAAQALRDVREMTQSRRELFPELGDALFVHRSVLSQSVLANNFRYMLRDACLPQVYTPSAIRVAVAVEVSGKTAGDLERVGRKLSHASNSASTPVYALRLAARLLLTRKIREYATLLEVAFATKAPSGPLALGYSPEVAQALLARAVETGLGFLCGDATAKGGTVSEDTASCPQLGRGCPGCQVRVFMADVDSLAEMVAVHESLDKKLDQYEEDKQDLWVENWIDLYAFASAVIQKAKRSRFAHLIPTARRKAQQMLTAGFEPMLIRE